MIIPVGISDFRDIRENGYYYVDKSKMIEKLLAEFFDISKDSQSLFKNLMIARNEKLCREWMNQYPTVFITLKSMTGLNFELAYGELARNISELYKRYLFVLDSEKINKYDKAIFERIARGDMSVTDVKTSLFKLTQILHLYYGKQVILLIDEYDVPVAKANDNGYYAEMMDVSRSLLEQALKDNRHLKLSVMTGYLTSAEWPAGEKTTLKIPNQEIQEIFRKSVQNWSIDKKYRPADIIGNLQGDIF